MTSVQSIAQARAKAPTWDLDVLFPGGSKSPDFARFRAELAQAVAAAETRTAKLPDPAHAQGFWQEFILQLQDLKARISTAGSFVSCLVGQNVKDDAAHAITVEIDTLASRWRNLLTFFETYALECSDARWEEFLSDTRLNEIRFYLSELRARAREKMPPEQERLAQELAVNGYHAWNRLYDKMAGDLAVDFTVEGETRTISLGQLAMYMSNSRRDVRREALARLEEAWESRASLAAMALNYQAGFRLSLYQRRGWDDVLHEPLAIGRLKKQTLEAMWVAVSDAVPRLVPYVDAKKKLLGIDSFHWYDQVAPAGAIERSWAFDEAGRFIVEQLADFSPEMARFTEMALRERWVEAENRANKAGGAYCTGFPTHKVTRVFMTWGGEYDHLMTLAHELGHAYHGWVLRDTPYMATSYPMNLAETASTFNEMRVTDAAMECATDPQEKLLLLDQKLQNALVMFCNLRARYLFDCDFYRERRRGMVPRARLDELMLHAQREAFGGMLAEPDGYHPLFWASKLHFYITGYPFYNYPYVFGFLFANGVYDAARREGHGFADRYRNLLADTGRMTCEDLARKHLGVDLTQRSFWDAAIARILADVAPFAQLANGG